jgi:choice-of-anchor A domain-containing protein
LLLGGEIGAEAWNVNLNGFEQAAPLDFNIVAFDGISGIPDAHGAIAAGGDITLQSFSINQVSQRPIGIVVGGTLQATNGTIVGDLAHAETPAELQSVTLTGLQHPSLPIDFAALEQGLVSMSQGLAALEPTGNMSLTFTHLELSGAQPDLNVFAVDAGTLSQARSIHVAAPVGAAALVNVSGADVSVTNTQMTLSGVTRSALLWNFSEASELSMSSVSFQGSALAPHAAATANSGNFEGTLVASSVLGNMQFHDFPLNAWESFGGSPGSGLTDTVTVTPEGRLRAGCEYCDGTDNTEWQFQLICPR